MFITSMNRNAALANGQTDLLLWILHCV